jgi:hypothetical protein
MWYVDEGVEVGDIALFAFYEVANGVEVGREGGRAASAGSSARHAGFEGGARRRTSQRGGSSTTAALQEGGSIDGASGGRRLCSLRSCRRLHHKHVDL